jgi:tetratricopeptide (TPR) repeat protein
MGALGRDDTEEAGTLLNNWALSVLDLGQPIEAERLLRRSVEISSADGTDRNVSPMVLNNLARPVLALGRVREAIDLSERAAAKAARAGDEVVLNQTLFFRTAAYRQAGEFPRAADMLSKLEERLRRFLPPGHTAFASLMSERSALSQARGDLTAATVEADRAIAMAEASLADPVYLSRFLLRRSGVALDAGRPESAQRDAERVLALEHQHAEPGSLSSVRGRAYLSLGRALAAQAKAGEARAALTAALEHLESTLGANHTDTRSARSLLEARK